MNVLHTASKHAIEAVTNQDFYDDDPVDATDLMSRDKIAISELESIQLALR